MKKTELTCEDCYFRQEALCGEGEAKENREDLEPRIGSHHSSARIQIGQSRQGAAIQESVVEDQMKRATPENPTGPGTLEERAEA